MQQPASAHLRVGVVTDRSGCAREEHWSKLLGGDHEVHRYPLADLVDQDYPVTDLVDLEDKPTFFLEELADLDVLIINWDALNGDPDFGADRALAWTAYRRQHILGWVADGGLLLVEGQANLAVPVQAAYDNLLGPGEVRLCGQEDPLEPRRQIDRIGHSCALTDVVKSQRTSTFRDTPTELHSAGVARAYSEMFPGAAGRLVPQWLSTHPWGAMYRGWFRWNRWRATRFAWAPIVATHGRSHNHPTMLAAAYGTKGGGIFVSTMLLASSDQKALVSALLACRGQFHTCFPGRLPRGPRLRRHVELYIVPILVAIAAGLLVSGSDVVKDAAKSLLTALVMVTAWILARSSRRLAKHLRDLRGV